MTELKSFDLNYLKLILEIDKHIDGYIDAYIGPPALKMAIDSQPPKTPDKLREDHALLIENIPSESDARRAYLSAILRAIGTTIEILAKKEIPYMEEVQRIYDIMPQRVDEARYLEAHNNLDTLLPGGEPLVDRLATARSRYDIPGEKLSFALELAYDETRERTKTLLDLPNNESVDVELVSGQPWGAYNWFKGQSKSLIEFNTDIPSSAFSVVPLFAHEGYPGHHTEAVLKEEKFWIGQGYGEAGAMLLQSPAAVISEGIAMTAVEIIFPAYEYLDWTLINLLPAISMEASESSQEIRLLQQSLLTLNTVSGNAAIYYHGGQISKEQTIDYLVSYGLLSLERAEKSFGFITHPLYRSYIFTYSEGHNLIDRAAENENKRDVFMNCLTEQILPSHLAAQGAKLARDS